MNTKRSTRKYYHVSMQDIADVANVSKATVSRALKNDHAISKTTRAKIKRIAKKLNYKPNILMQSIMTSKTYNIGVFVPDISQEFWGKVVMNIEQLSDESGYEVFITNTINSKEKEKHCMERMISKRVDGMIIVPSPENIKSEHFVELLEANIPFVILDRYFQDIDAYFVTCDGVHGGFLATEHLIKLGHKRIAHIAGPKGPANMSTSVDREEGYRKAMIKYELPICEEYVIHTHFYNHQKEGYAAAKQLLELQQPPTAIYACTDLTAIGAYRAIHEKGLKIPQDISVVGYADLPMAEHLNPSMTTIKQPSATMAQESFRLLKLQMNDKSTNQDNKHVVLPAKLIKRNSTAPPALKLNLKFQSGSQQIKKSFSS